MIKFVKSECKFFKGWTNEEFGVRIILDKADKSFYKYQVQKFNGKTWNKVRGFHTLDEAKAFSEEVI